jgi:tetratricopeptide (TPR) repeat protein
VVLGAVAFLSAAGCGTGRSSQWEAPTTANKTAPTVAAAEDHASAAEKAWANRDQLASLQQAIAHWETVAASKPEDVATWARLSRAYYVMADGHLRGDGAECYLATFERGTAAGERALAAASPEFKARVTKGEKVEDAIKVVGKEGIEAMYWYAVNLGKWSRGKGLAALLGNKDRVKGVLTRVLELDETFFYGAPHRYFGAYWSLVPVGRDLDKSKQHFEKSLSIAPGYAGTKVLMAESYAVKKQDRALFLKLLDEVLAMPEDAIPELAPEARLEEGKARELKGKADELF